MASQELKQIWEALKKVSDKQEEYKKLYLKNQEQDTAASNSFAGTIDVQGKHLEEVSEMISSIEVTVRELAHKVSINERRIDDLEQYSRSNCLILHQSCQSGSGFSGSGLDFEKLSGLNRAARLSKIEVFSKR